MASPKLVRMGAVGALLASTAFALGAFAQSPQPMPDQGRVPVLVELFTSTVRATAASFVFNGARLIAWIFPIIAGTLVTKFGGVANAALIMASIYVIGLIVPWFLPETAGKPMPQ